MMEKNGGGGNQGVRGHTFCFREIFSMVAGPTWSSANVKHAVRRGKRIIGVFNAVGFAGAMPPLQV